MSEVETAGEGRVSGNQASISAGVRRQMGIEDGDILRWRVVDGQLEVNVVHRRTGVFDDFEPRASDEPVDVVESHDGFGVE